MAKLYRAQTNAESYLITACILACIVPPSTDIGRLVLIALAGVIAMASKYILVYRGSHIFNPAATGAFVLSVTGLLPATWWVATPALTLVLVIVGLAVLRKTRRFQVFFLFTAVAVGVLLAVGLAKGQPMATILYNATFSWPIIFFGTIMLTEPSTMPAARRYQLLYAGLVGSLFASQLHIGAVSTTPQLCLLVGNLFVLLVAPSKGMIVRLVSIRRLSSSQYDLAFAMPSGNRLPFIPGQYAEWTLQHPKTDIRGNRRSFSIASSPVDDELHIGVRQFEPSSSFKAALLRLKPGDKVRVAHPAGSFTLPDDTSQPLVFVAGGIGITPFRSIVQDMVDRGVRRDITLVYVANEEQDFIYKDTFQKAKKLGVTTHYVAGRLQPQEFRKLVPGLLKSIVYVSGPDAMVSAYQTNLRKLGVPKACIKTDHFSGY
jgi:ferredoxin-NADP reductase